MDFDILKKKYNLLIIFLIIFYDVFFQKFFISQLFLSVYKDSLYISNVGFLFIIIVTGENIVQFIDNFFLANLSFNYILIISFCELLSLYIFFKIFNIEKRSFKDLYHLFLLIIPISIVIFVSIVNSNLKSVISSSDWIEFVILMLVYIVLPLIFTILFFILSLILLKLFIEKIIIDYFMNVDFKDSTRYNMSLFKINLIIILIYGGIEIILKQLDGLFLILLSILILILYTRAKKEISMSTFFFEFLIVISISGIMFNNNFYNIEIFYSFILIFLCLFVLNWISIRYNSIGNLLNYNNYSILISNFKINISLVLAILIPLIIIDLWNFFLFSMLILIIFLFLNFRKVKYKKNNYN